MNLFFYLPRTTKSLKMTIGILLKRALELTRTQLAQSYDNQNFQAFFTDADEIRLLMQELLGNVKNKKLLEPCAGEGAFLDGLQGKPSLVHAVDIDKNHIDFLKQRFGNSVATINTDFIDTFVSGELFEASPILTDYDAVICNPPYGLRFTVDYRKTIKKRYPQLYARESYGLFLYFGINSLASGGRFVYIVPDTFFTSRNHMPLRQFLADQTSITDIIQFRSKRFETVNFGYGNLCIVAGFKTKPTKGSCVRWSDARESVGSLKAELANSSEALSHSYFADNASTGWVHPKIRRAIQLPDSALSLGDIAECRTGIYTGDNQKFCAYDSENPPSRANGHSVNWSKYVHTRRLTDAEKKSGLEGDCHYVPFIRGGHRKPFERTSHAIKWSSDAVSFYGSDKKARLQNHDFYFRSGLAIPMVTSGRLTASLIDNSIFDQGVVGVFPHDKDFMPFLLLYLNSPIVTKYKAMINPGANNSANYIKRIPMPVVGKDLLNRGAAIVEKSKVVGWKETESDRQKIVDESIAC